MEFLSPREAVEYTNKSYPTINRLVKEIRKGKDKSLLKQIQSKRNKHGYLVSHVSSEYLKSYYKLDHEFVRNIDHDQCFSQKDNSCSNGDKHKINDNDHFYELVLERQREYNIIVKDSQNTIKELQDTIKEIIQGKPFYRLASFWISLFFVCLIGGLTYVGFLYLNETKNLYDNKITMLNNNNTSRINDLKQGYSIQIQDQKTELANQQARYKELEDQFTMMINTKEKKEKTSSKSWW